DRYRHNTVIDHADVWWSADGKAWKRATRAARWTPRRFHGSVVYDGRMWVLGGYHRGNRNDVWHSRDGTTWHEVKSNSVWPARHEPACLVFAGRLWVLGGFGQELYNDVWTFTRKPAN